MKYKAVEDCWWDWTERMSFFKVYDEAGNEVKTNGTPYNEESLYLAILELHGINVEVEYPHYE